MLRIQILSVLMKKIKILTVVGTRPEIIRLSRVISLLENNLNSILIHTGQNYDYELNKIFFKDLGLKKQNIKLTIRKTLTFHALQTF